MNWIQKLQSRWNVGSTFQVIIILVVFACTGLTIYFLKGPILQFVFGDDIPRWARILYYVLILPIYNILLLFYGFVFGQFYFFWSFEIRSFKKLIAVFKKK